MINDLPLSRKGRNLLTLNSEFSLSGRIYLLFMFVNILPIQVLIITNVLCEEVNTNW